MQQQNTPQAERELPMLAGIGALVTWCEDLLAVLSGPILTAGLAIALVDLLSDGQLFTRLPVLLWVWAGSMALGLDAQFIGSSAKLARAMRQRRGWVAFGYIILCISLGYVAFLATYVFAVQEANGITTSEALARLGMDGTTWIFQRSILAVILVFLSGLLRYVPPATDDALAAVSEEERLQREIRLAPLRAQLRAQQARGARGMVAALTGREQPTAAQTVKPHLVAASQTLPLTETLEHHVASAAAYKAMHDPEMSSEPADPWAYDDEVENEAEALFGTLDLAKDDLASAVDAASDTSSPKRRARTPNNSGPRRDNLARSKSMREFNRKLKSDAKAQRRAAIRDAVYAILDEWHAAGRVEAISDKELARRVATRVNFDVNPSGNTVARWRGPWQSSRAHKAALESPIPEDIEPMEPQELRELQEVW